MKFKIGDIVIGNAKASERYSVTKEGFIGEVIGIEPENEEYLHARINISSVKSVTDWSGQEHEPRTKWYHLDETCFDLYEFSSSLTGLLKGEPQ